MSNERDTQAGGSPVEESEATPTQVQAAVHRAVAPVVPVLVQPPVTVADAAEAGSGTGSSQSDSIQGASELKQAEGTPAPAATLVASASGEATRIAPLIDIPSAGENQTPEQIFAAAAASSGAARALQTPTVPAVNPLEAAPVTPQTGTAKAEQSSAALAAALEEQPPRDGEIRISADHPMATLYMQSPMPPDLRGNRVAGFWISLLSTAAFALLFAGAIALIIAPVYPPSTYLTDGLVPSLLNPSFFVPVIAFLFTSVVMVLIVGRAGWWAHIIGSFVVALVTGALALIAILVDLTGGVNALLADMSVQQLTPGILVTTFAIAVLAREVSMWFGAWIGARGRKMTRLNNEAMDAYEAALADVKSPQVAPVTLS